MKIYWGIWFNADEKKEMNGNVDVAFISSLFVRDVTIWVPSVVSSTNFVLIFLSYQNF